MFWMIEANDYLSSSTSESILSGAENTVTELSLTQQIRKLSKYCATKLRELWFKGWRNISRGDYRN